MMFKIRQGLTFNKVRNILVSTAGSFMGIRFSISRKAITHLIQSSGHPSLKIENYREYLEPGGWVVWIHENFQLDQLRLVFVRPINLIHLLHLGNKRNGGEFLGTKKGKAAADLENLLIAIIWIEILQEKCDHSGLC
jgi:hypothetical protein